MGGQVLRSLLFESPPLLSPRWATRTNITLGNPERKVAAGFLGPRKPVFLHLGCFYLTETLPISFWSSDTESLFCMRLRLPLKEIADNVPDEEQCCMHINSLF